MERLLALEVPALAVEAADGSTLRRTLALHDALTLLCPFTDVVRCDLFVLPLRGPSRFFGGEERVLAAVAEAVRTVLGVEGRLGVGDGLVVAALAARDGVVLAPGESASWFAAQPLAVLGHRGLTRSGPRLGFYTVGDFARVAPARVAERFDATVRHLHRVARGETNEWPGLRDPRVAPRLATLRHGTAHYDEQLGFFGQRGAAELRVDEAARRVRHRLGPDGVRVAYLRPGRRPEDRGELRPWGAPVPARDAQAPWPGGLPGPAPVTTLTRPVAVDLCDGEGRPVVYGRRGTLNTTPVTVVLGSRRESISWWAGPWPLVERWWESPRRRAHAQLVCGSGMALLVAAEAGRWWLVGIYD